VSHLESVDDSIMQRNALNLLFQSTNGMDWSLRDGWGDNARSYCSWYGVSCDVSSNVIGLSLNSNNLDGTLPPSIGNLTGLLAISLARNNLIGSIPVEILNCPSLKVINVSYNALVGSIPSEISKLSRLEELNLGFNLLSGTLPQMLSDCAELQILRLTSNRIEGAIYPSLSQLTNLKELDVGANLLSSTLPESLGKLTQLTSFLVGFNKVSGTIPESIGNLTSLVTLRLCSNNLGGTMPQSLGKLLNLEDLDFNSNMLLSTVPESVWLLPSLTTLHLQVNQLTGTIPNVVSGSLTSLIMYENQISGTIPETLFTLPNLETVYFGNNALSGTLPSSLVKATKLCCLGLNDNQLHGEIPDGFGASSNITRVYLGGNALSGTIPSSLFVNGYMIFLHLFGNDLAGTLPNGITTNAQLVSLLLGHNRLEGTIPPLASSLESVVLAYNNFEGSIDNLGLLSFPSLIDISGNSKLSGDIPSEITALSSLDYFFAGDTNLRSSASGTLPSRLRFSTSRQQSHLVNGYLIECPAVILEANPFALFNVDPAYYQYVECWCPSGSQMRVDLCEACPVGTFNDLSTPEKKCQNCDDHSYAPNTGSIHCTPCVLPLDFRQSSSHCIDLRPIYGLSLLVVGGSITITASVVLFLIGMLMIGARILSVQHRRKLSRLRLRIEQRARNEIPADLVIPYRDLIMEQIIGSGSFARVYRGLWKQTRVAIKELTILADQREVEPEFMSHTYSMGNNSRRSHSTAFRGLDNTKSKLGAGEGNQVLAFREEVLVMSRLHHPNVLLLVGASTAYPHLCIVTEYMKNGSLFDQLHVSGAADYITRQQQYSWLSQIANGMEYLHSQMIVHRDLKSLNVLLDDMHAAKICDFGLAKLCGDQRNHDTVAGSVIWMAPELILEKNTHSCASDVYAFGMVAWEIMSPEEYPFDRKSLFAVSKLVVEGTRPPVDPIWPSCICDGINECLLGDPEERPTFEQLVVRLARLKRCKQEPDPVQRRRTTEAGIVSSMLESLLPLNGE
jgi:serine/threonine protein kinase/Leucine-rich repeat (LRR) protein